MKVRIAVNPNMFVELEPSDECQRGNYCEYVLDKLCREHDCELIGRPYSVGGGYQAQDFLSRQTWRWYTMEFNDSEYKLYYYRRLKLFYKCLTPDIMKRQGYPVDEESLRAMGLREQGGKIANRRRGNVMR